MYIENLGGLTVRNKMKE